MRRFSIIQVSAAHIVVGQSGNDTFTFVQLNMSGGSAFVRDLVEFLSLIRVLWIEGSES